MHLHFANLHGNVGETGELDSVRTLSSRALAKTEFTSGESAEVESAQAK